MPSSTRSMNGSNAIGLSYYHSPGRPESPAQGQRDLAAPAQVGPVGEHVEVDRLELVELGQVDVGPDLRHQELIGQASVEVGAGALDRAARPAGQAARHLGQGGG